MSQCFDAVKALKWSNSHQAPTTQQAQASLQHSTEWVRSLACRLLKHNGFKIPKISKPDIALF